MCILYLVTHNRLLSIAQQGGGSFICKPGVFARFEVGGVDAAVFGLCPSSFVVLMNPLPVVVAVRNLSVKEDFG